MRGTFTVRRAVTRTGLSSDSVQAIFEDRDGNLWVGTTGGLHRLTRRKLTPIDDIGAVLATAPARAAGCGSARPVDSAARAGGRCARAAAYRPQRAGHPQLLHRPPLACCGWAPATGCGNSTASGSDKVRIPERPQMLVRWLAPDRRGGFWLGDGDWLYRWDGAHLTPFTSTALGAGTRIRFAGADATGRVWLGLTGGHLGFIDERGRPSSRRSGGRTPRRHACLHQRHLRGSRSRRLDRRQRPEPICQRPYHHADARQRPA